MVKNKLVCSCPFKFELGVDGKTCYERTNLDTHEVRYSSGSQWFRPFRNNIIGHIEVTDNYIVKFDLRIIGDPVDRWANILQIGKGEHQQPSIYRKA